MAVTGVWCLPLWRWLEKKVVTHLSKMLINGEIDENTTVSLMQSVMAKSLNSRWFVMVALSTKLPVPNLIS